MSGETLVMPGSKNPDNILAELLGLEVDWERHMALFKVEDAVKEFNGLAAQVVFSRNLVEDHEVQLGLLIEEANADTSPDGQEHKAEFAGGIFAIVADHEGRAASLVEEARALTPTLLRLGVLRRPEAVAEGPA